MNRQWNDKILTVSPADFEDLALEQFRFQFAFNPVYQQYAEAVGKTPATVKSVYQVPFLPIRFFKSHPVQTTSFDPQVIFESSGTTGENTSRHFIKDALLYKRIFSEGNMYVFRQRLNKLPPTPANDRPDILNYVIPEYTDRDKGELRLTLNEIDFLSESVTQNDTMVFKVAITDRGGHTSDTLVTDQIVVLLS